MAKLSTHQIRELARKAVANHEGGIPYSELHEQIAAQNPETPKNTIHGSIWDLHLRFPQEISKPSRGLFVPTSTVTATNGGAVIPPVPPKFNEEDFYAPFAEWLVNDLDEATDAAELGGAAMGKKWGTPDVVGIY